MPVTPFHFGPGALIASVAPRRVSFAAFCVTNVGIDIESLLNLLTHQPRVHTFFHTYLGATLAAGCVVAVWAVVRKTFPSLDRSTTAIALGAWVGAWTHVLLDSVMHRDITPLAPWSTTNSLQGCIGLFALHASCLIAGGLGLIVWLWRRSQTSR